MYLVDTNVISAGDPAKHARSPDLIRWMDENAHALFLSVITVAEIEDGIAKARRQEAGRKADRLSAWLETVLHLYAARILPIDLRVAQCLGRLSDQARSAGQAPGFADLAIAATAVSHGLTILTRNLRHFGTLPVPCHDPFAAVPPAVGGS